MSTDDQLPALPEQLRDDAQWTRHDSSTRLLLNAADEIDRLRTSVAQRDEQIAALRATNAELLAALRASQDWMRGNGELNIKEVLDKAAAAIAKATGEAA